MSAACLALGLVYAIPAITCGAELTAPLPKAEGRGPSFPPCTNDATGKISLQGSLRGVGKSAQVASVMQFFASSEETDYYVGGLESQLAGRSPAVNTQQGSSSQVITDTLRHMQGLPVLLGSAKSSVISANGAFSCAGFLPGNYVLLGTLTSEPDQRGYRVHSYWRADVTIPSPNSRRVYNISGFRYIGQAAAP